MNRPLPLPTRERWQPLRAGLVDLFYYDQEEFWFREGRLLLRGNNGTGKSKVLALTLPFLLDGELSPHRVEPDADPKKRMEWNLLLGGAHPHSERLGYTWLEFGRLREDGAADFRTIGCGLKAVSGRGIARHWFFVTSRRIGAELSLVDATRTSLTRDRLDEALGEHGMVYDRAREYRRAVDETLFGVGEQRYAALVNLLIQLRAPQLSKRPSEKALSAALTEALPPLDQAVVADVAEAFRSLEEDRDALAAMSEAQHGADSFLHHYRRYAQTAARRRAAEPRRAQSAYEKLRAELAAAETAYADAGQELEAAENALAELEQAKLRLQTRDETLRASPEMRSARELERAAEDARRLAGDAERAARECATAATQVEKRRAKAAAAESRVSTAEQELDAARGEASGAARTAHLAEAHARDVDAALDHTTEGSLRSAAEQLADRQQRATTHVEGLIRSAEEAQRSVAARRQRVEDLLTEAGDLAERRAGATSAVRECGADLVAATRRYLQTVRECSVDDPAAVLAALELWVDTVDGANPARAAVDAAGHAAAGRLARAEAALDARAEAARQRETELATEMQRLERGEDAVPPSPHTRAPSTRDDRVGAPLWQLVDFADELGSEDRAGLEAALEASGMLDAWVSPRGELIAPDTQDVLLRPEPSAPRPTASLAGTLRPAVDRENPRAAAVSDEAVVAILSAVGLGEHSAPTWVSTTGRFRLGVLEGAWRKPTAVYIGRGAREAARRARLAELRAELAEVRNQLSRVAAERDELTARRGALGGELADCPDDTALRAAHATVEALDAEAERLAERQAAASEGLARATEAAEQAAGELADGSAELGLPADAHQLAAVRDGLHRYRLALAVLWPALRERAGARREAGEAREELGLAESELAHRTERAGSAERAAIEATERYRTLDSTVGVAVAELQRQLAEVADELRSCEQQRRAADGRRTNAVRARGRAEGQLETLREQLGPVTAERAAAAESLRRFAATGLLTVALPELPTPDTETPWAPDPAVRLARQVERELAEVADDDTAWERVQRRVTEEFKTLGEILSRHGNTASAQLLDEGIVVDVMFQGRPCTVPQLVAALSAEVTERRRLLDEREREILENHLVNEVASTLQELISAAEAQVARMNAELAERPTSTGMRLRLLWQPADDGPAGLAAARERLLRQTSDAWSEDDRTAVGAFLQARIAEVRAENTAGTWLEHLTEALDYRGWHQFVIQRHQNGQWRSATGPASGGERVLAASVPLFAAASSHYASAGNPYAPRLVTLDEAFAGVDDDSRAKCMGLLAAFDLDVVMTSEREWGCYPEVSGLAIAQLSRTDDVPAVLVTPWEWNGRQLVQVARPDPASTATAGEQAPTTSVEQNALWN